MLAEIRASAFRAPWIGTGTDRRNLGVFGAAVLAFVADAGERLRHDLLKEAGDPLEGTIFEFASGMRPLVCAPSRQAQ